MENVNQQRIRLEKKLTRLNEADHKPVDAKQQEQVDKDTLLRKLIGLKMKHDQDVEGSIIHAFTQNQDKLDVFVVVSFPTRPDLMSTIALSAVKDKLLECNDKAGTEAKLRALEHFNKSKG